MAEVNNMTIPKETNSLTAPKKHRDSNLEFFRILTMLLIVAHHYVVNSGLFVKEGYYGQWQGFFNVHRVNIGHIRRNVFQ